MSANIVAQFTAAERLAAVHIGDMHLHRRNTDRPQRIQKRYGGMRIRAGVEHNSVRLAVCLLNGIHQIALMVGLEAFDRMAAALCKIGHLFHKLGIGIFAVNIRLADAEHIQIRAVDYKDFHAIPYPPFFRLAKRSQMLRSYLWRTLPDSHESESFGQRRLYTGRHAPQTAFLSVPRRRPTEVCRR